VDTGGVASTGDVGTGGDKETGGSSAMGGVEVSTGGAVTMGGATKAEADGEFERLWGVLRDPSLKTFFNRLRNPLDSLAAWWRSSAMLIRVG